MRSTVRIEKKEGKRMLLKQGMGNGEWGMGNRESSGQR